MIILLTIVSFKNTHEIARDNKLLYMIVFLICFIVNLFFFSICFV